MFLFAFHFLILLPKFSMTAFTSISFRSQLPSCIYRFREFVCSVACTCPFVKLVFLSGIWFTQIYGNTQALPQSAIMSETRSNGLKACFWKAIMASILLHCCCGPCATYTVKWLREHNFGVTAFWYNPNIHPFMEHQKRLESMQMLAKEMNLPLIIAAGYEMVDYFRAVVGHEGNRCPDCYRLRLGKTAQVARENGFDAFTTT